MTLLIAILSALAVTDPVLVAHIGSSAPMLVVLGSLLIGGIVGSLLRLEERVESLGGWLQSRLTREEGSAERNRFVEGFVAASLLFCTGPLTILGSLNDGLGRGADELFLKSALDGFAAMAFAASFGWGVAASALTVIVVQGGLTVVGGLLLVGIALRLLRGARDPGRGPDSGPRRGAVPRRPGGHVAVTPG